MFSGSQSTRLVRPNVRRRAVPRRTRSPSHRSEVSRRLRTSTSPERLGITGFIVGKCLSTSVSELIRRRGTLLYCVVTHHAGVCFLHGSTCLPYLFTGSLLYNRLCEQVTDGARMPKRSQSKWQETSLFTTTSNVVKERRYCRSMPNQP